MEPCGATLEQKISENVRVSNCYPAAPGIKHLIWVLHCLSGAFAYFPSGSRARPNPGKNSHDNAAHQIMPRLANDAVKFVMLNLAETPHLRVATKSNVSD